jgi:stearoyl-CoA desaturase (delta-9 desaturase)
VTYPTAGVLEWPWWAVLLTTLAFTHVTIIGVTVYLHRRQAHRAVWLHPAVELFFRSWLWLTTGMNTREWTAVHRKHHAFVEMTGDPHSPKVFGIRKVMWQGAELYREEAANADTLTRYGQGTPDDWLERHVFAHDKVGVTVMLGVDLVLFGALGLTVWAVQMVWIPFFAAGVINGAGHWRGYRNVDTADSSTNLVPWGVLIGGEELHNNHHAFPSSACFRLKPWELDIGWTYLLLLRALGLARIERVAPRLDAARAQPGVDGETLSAMLVGHWQVMADYAQQVVRRVHREEIREAPQAAKPYLRPLARLIARAPRRLAPGDEAMLWAGLAQSRALATVYQFQQRLQALVAERSASQERLLTQLHEWCREAEASGVAALEEFVGRIRAYVLKTA